jgi:glycine cleavage system aminomethyltransferase T
VPAEHGAALWDALLSAGARFGAQPFGVEALLALRTEKGFLHVGADTDGTTVPDDVGLSSMVAKKSGDFVGRRSLTLAENLRSDRFQLVGLRLIGDPLPFVAGAHLLSGAKVAPPVETEVPTSACRRRRDPHRPGMLARPAATGDGERPHAHRTTARSSRRRSTIRRESVSVAEIPDLARISALGEAVAELRFEGCTLRELPDVAKPGSRRTGAI